MGGKFQIDQGPGFVIQVANATLEHLKSDVLALIYGGEQGADSFSRLLGQAIRLARMAQHAAADFNMGHRPRRGAGWGKAAQRLHNRGAGHRRSGCATEAQVQVGA